MNRLFVTTHLTGEEKMWPEILQALTENRRELILSGIEIAQRIAFDDLDENIYKLKTLNLLQISEAGLEVISSEISNLNNLQTLILHTNRLRIFPLNICDLPKLKTLDLSNNSLEELPESLNKLVQLTTLNLSSNKIEKCPNLKEMIKLAVLDLSNNKLSAFPDVCNVELQHLAELRLNSNEIVDIPHEINHLVALKVLDLSHNQIKTVPGELSDISKLKDINLKDNPISDKRLYKLINQCRAKQVLDYVRQHCSRISNICVGKKGNKKAQTGKTVNATTVPTNDDVTIENQLNKIIVCKTNDTDEYLHIKLIDTVKNVRPYILACILKQVKFDESMFRRFIQLQTKLHDSICEKRNAATIATHDLNKLTSISLTYTALPPNDLVICPLNRATPCTGAKLFAQLRQEADNLRKEKKRNTYSGVHRFLYLIEGKPLYPCLIDGEKRVISFPPITNSDDTKISVETSNILIEVTSASGQDICKRVLDTILKESLELGVGGKIAENGVNNVLTVQKVKIVDLDGNLKAVYPSRADLHYDKNLINVVRE